MCTRNRAFFRTWFTVAVLWATASISAQQFPSLEGRRLDLDYVANKLPASHPNFFAHLAPAAYQQAVLNLSAKLTSASDAEFYAGLSQLVAMAGDAHTSLGYTAPFRFFPLRLRSFDDGIFVTRAAAPYVDALATRLVRIGDTPIDKALELIATVIPHENRYWLSYSYPSYIVNQTILQGLGLAMPNSTTPLTFRTLSGREFTLDVDTSPAPLLPAVSEDDGPFPLYQQKATDNYWYTYLPSDRVLYFRYNACIDMPARPFASFAADLMAALDANPVDTFVLDIRFNGGGNSGLVGPIFNGLASRFSRLTANPQFRIYNVFSNGTISSALLNSEDLLIPFPMSIINANRNVNLSTRVVSIGQPTGGKPTHYGNVTGFQLPGSGFPGQRSTVLWTAPAGIPDSDSLYPSIALPSQSTDYFGRFDPVMAAILGRGTGAPAPPSGDVITVNAASFRTDQGVAPGSYASAFGNFGKIPDEVAIGETNTAPVSASESQVNFVVPNATPVGVATVTVRSAGQSLAQGKLTISRTGPGIFVAEPGSPFQPGAVLNQDGTLNTASNPAAVGTIVQIYATGYGNQPVRAYFSETPGEILFSGTLAQFAGLWQINSRVPAGVGGQVSLFLFSGDLASNGVTIWIK